MIQLENYFKKYRSNIMGIDQEFDSPYGRKKIVYADWIASGRLYKPIEDKITECFAPFVGNTHSESSITGTLMTQAYHKARGIIKKHVNAGANDVIITHGSGMTTVVNKFQRILGLKVSEQLRPYLNLPKEKKPVVFITHMEHHSNHTSWLETVADVIIIEPDAQGHIDINNFKQLLEKYKDRELKFGSFTAASNVTGVFTDYHKLAKLMHKHGGYCFVDFAAAAPYVNINMHPEDPEEKLDAIFFSPHKFIGGPGTTGVLIFDSNLYRIKAPDHPGGGTVDWTNPWGQHKYINDIEAREDGGTPGFLQTIKASFAIMLKEEIGVENMLAREEELLKIAFEGFKKIPTVHILAPEFEKRLGVISFYVENIHYNLMVKILNDRFGIQVRGGCSCAGTYGHYLLHVDPTRSRRITEQINAGDLSEKPGWVRLSIHPTMTDEELYYTLNAIKEIIDNIDEWEKDYSYSNKTNEFTCNKYDQNNNIINQWFTIN